MRTVCGEVGGCPTSNPRRVIRQIGQRDAASRGSRNLRPRSETVSSRLAPHVLRLTPPPLCVPCALLRPYPFRCRQIRRLPQHHFSSQRPRLHRGLGRVLPAYPQHRSTGQAWAKCVSRRVGRSMLTAKIMTIARRLQMGSVSTLKNTLRLTLRLPRKKRRDICPAVL